MPKLTQIEDRVCYARESGVSFWDIKTKYGLSVAKVTAIVRENAPHVLHNTTAVKVSWQAVLLFKRGMTYGKIAKQLGISKSTAVRAVATGLKSWERRGEDFKRL